jgi:hypothetical protein
MFCDNKDAYFIKVMSSANDIFSTTHMQAIDNLRNLIFSW